MLRVEHTEEHDSHKAEIVLQDSDKVLNALDLKGYKLQPRWGLITSDGSEYSETAPLWVRDQRGDSVRGRMICTLSCIGIPDRLAEEKADDDYRHHWSSTKTVLDLITEIADGAAVAETLIEKQDTSDSYIELRAYDVGTTQLNGNIKTEADVGDTSIALKGLGTGTINRTTKLSISGDSTDYFVTANATITANEATVTISPGLAQLAEVDTLINLNWRWGTGQTGTTHGAGQRLYIKNTDDTARTVSSISFRLKKTGSPTGNVTFIITYVDDESTAGSIILGDASTLTTSPVWYKGTLASPVAIDPTREVYLWCQYTAGTAANYVEVSYNSEGVKFDEHFIYILSAGNPYIIDDSSYDCAYRYDYAGAGIPVFQHCHDATPSTGWVVTDDTAAADSLLDSYCPCDAFFIRQGESRLNVIDKLLAYTGTERRFEDDGWIHLRVPVITGSTYDYEYALTSGHTFFGKSVREALVIPNKIVVESFPDDDDQYTGSHTSAASYALMPVCDFIRTKLTSSDPQAIAIATARIHHLEVASQRGSASVPMNVGAELWDYVLVTDERAGDTRTGNIGYLKRVYDQRAKIYQMTFGFGGVAVKGVPGTQLSSLKSEISEYDIMYGATVPATWGILLPHLRLHAEAIDKMQKALNDILVGLGYYDGQIPIGDQIKDALGELPAGSTYADRMAELRAITVLQTARALDTIYQNTTGKLLVQTITVILATTDNISFQMDSTTAPTTVRARLSQTGATSVRMPFTFIVPVNWYFRFLIVAGAPTVSTYSDEYLF
uniref:Tail protein n=1 Tax=viral metagenome TaxID=1070528 RepID=A0A6M3J729_9ZZZZ